MREIEKDQDAYREGLFVRALGRTRSSNPYSQDTLQSVLWEKGWTLIDTPTENIRENIPMWDAVLQPVGPRPEFAPEVISADSFQKQLKAPTVVVSRQSHLVGAIAFVYLGMFVWALVAMWR